MGADPARGGGGRPEGYSARAPGRRGLWRRPAPLWTAADGVRDAVGRHPAAPASAARRPHLAPALATILRTVPHVLATVAHVLIPVTDVLAAVATVLDPVTASAVDPGVAHVLAAIADVLAPVPHILTPVAHVLAAVATILYAVAARAFGAATSGRLRIRGNGGGCHEGRGGEGGVEKSAHASSEKVGVA